MIVSSSSWLPILLVMLWSPHLLEDMIATLLESLDPTCVITIDGAITPHIYIAHILELLGALSTTHIQL